MKKPIFLIIIVLFLFACSKPDGELVSPPDGLETAVKQYLTEKFETSEFKELSVREYENGVYLVSQTYSGKDGSRVAFLIVQKSSGGWQVLRATKERRKMFGIN